VIYVNIIELIFLSLALATDAFAVAVCIGLTMPGFKMKNAVIVGLYFGIFQAIMPLLGYFIGGVFTERVAAFDHWIAFVLLSILGGKMIYGSFKKEEEIAQASLTFFLMLPLALATSIDALAAGVTFAFLQVNILPAIALIGIITFFASALAVRLGDFVGNRFKSKAEFAGGIVLIFLAVRGIVTQI